MRSSFAVPHFGQVITQSSLMTRPLPTTFCPRLFLKKLCDVRVILSNSQHDCLRSTGFHFVSNREHFFGAEAPVFRIVPICLRAYVNRGGLVAALASLCARKLMLSINFDIVRCGALCPPHRWLAFPSTSIHSDVRFGSKACISRRNRHVGLTPKPDIVSSGRHAPLRVNS